MPSGVWRAGVIVSGLVLAVWPGAASAQSPPEALPVSPANDGAVKDLTPPALAEPFSPAEPSHTESHTTLQRAGHDEGGLFASAEYLLWRPRRDAFDYALANSTNGLATTGRLENLSYELQSGIRGTLGYRLPGAGWDTLFTYTHLGSSANSRLLAGPGQVIFPTLTRPGLTDQVQTAEADASLMYNVYDLELGKRFAVDEYFSGRAFGGLRFADIRQDLSAAYDGLDARQAAVGNKSTFYGAGPMAGLEGQFGGWKGFHLYARASGGLLTGKVNNPLAETNNAGQTTYVNLSNDGRKVVPVATLAIGGGWQRRTVSVRFGYEVTNYFGLTDQPRFVDDVAQGKLVTRPADLSLEGFVARFALAF